MQRRTPLHFYFGITYNIFMRENNKNNLYTCETNKIDQNLRKFVKQKRISVINKHRNKT